MRYTTNALEALVNADFAKRLAEAASLLLLVVNLTSSYNPALSLGPQQEVESINPKMGVHTRLTDEVEEWKIKRTLTMVREMGASWVVEYFPWAYIEPRKGHFNWQHADVVVNHALAQGLTVIARLDMVPEWARPEETAASYLGEEHLDDFGDFVYAFVRHFRGRVGHLIIWNEPNLSLEWGFRPPDPKGYTKLLKLAYLRAKEADPECLVLAAGLAPTLAGEDDPWGMSDLAFLEQMYSWGAKDYFDLMAIHAYGLRAPPDEPPSEEKINFRRAELIHQVMVSNGDEGKGVIITEGGWNDHPRWTKAVRPSQRIEYTIRAYDKALKDWEWCQAVAFWQFRTPKPSHTYRDYFTFVTADFFPKPLYLEVQKYAQGSGRGGAGH